MKAGEKLTIRHVGGTVKTVEFEGLIPSGGWVQVRYPNGAGCYSFALAHGRVETKRGETALWSLDAADLERARELAKEAKVKWRKPRGPGRPRRPKSPHPNKQAELF
jgi:hypothetical protein